MIEVTDKIREKLYQLKYNSINNFFYYLVGGRSKYHAYKMDDSVPNYLDVDDGGYITYISRSGASKIKESPWESDKRQKTTISKLFSKYNIAEPLMDFLISEWKFLFDDSLAKDLEVHILTGEDIIRAFNYKGEFDMSKFAYSCAMFSKSNDHLQYDWYKFYIDNPQFSAVVVKDKSVNRFIARTLIISGESEVDNNDFKRGQVYKLHNRIYSEGKTLGYVYITKWLRENGYLDAHKHYNFSVKVDNVDYKQFPAVDDWYMDFNNKTLHTKENANFTRLYNLVRKQP